MSNPVLHRTVTMEEAMSKALQQKSPRLHKLIVTQVELGYSFADIMRSVERAGASWLIKDAARATINHLRRQQPRV